MGKKKVGQIVLALTVILFFLNVSEAKERQVAVTFHINLNAPANSKDVRLWIPYPVSDENQTVKKGSIDGNYSSYGIYKEKEFGNALLYAEWNNPTKDRHLTYTF